jgi:hypothetical protein
MKTHYILLGLVLACLGLGLIVGEVRSDAQSWSLISQWVSGSGTLTSGDLRIMFTTGEMVNSFPLHGGGYTLESGFPFEVSGCQYFLFLPLVSH